MRRSIDTHELVSRIRVAVIEKLWWAGPLVTEDVLSAVAAVPYRGDRSAYLNEVIPIITSTYQKVMHARLDSNAEAAERFRRDIEEFEQMRTVWA
jgi:hypothetical protein